MRNDFGEFFDEILLITQEEKITGTTPSGKTRTRTKVTNLFPGYIYARLVMTDDVWYAIRNTKYVSGIIGSHGGGAKPQAVRDEDMNRLLRLANRYDLIVREDIELFVGDRVMINDGPMAGYSGSVVSFEKTKNIVKLSVDKFKDVSVVVETDKISKIGKFDEAIIG